MKLVCSGIILAAALNAATLGTETFSGGLNGWDQSTVSSTVVLGIAGGNPDEFVAIRRNSDGDIGTRSVGPSVTGDYITTGVTGVSVDVISILGTVTEVWLRFRPDIATNGWHYVLTTAPVDSWTTYFVFFNPQWSDAEALAAGWVQEPTGNPSTTPSFASLMASVGWTEVRFILPEPVLPVAEIAALDIDEVPVNGSTLVGVDNFTLLGVPEPGTWALMGAGLAAVLAARRKRL